MPYLIWTPGALDDLDRLQRFLQPKNPPAAKRALDTILSAAAKLEEYPHAGRHAPEFGEAVRQLPVHFSTGGYLIRYRVVGEAVQILWVRHQREQPWP